MQLYYDATNYSEEYANNCYVNISDIQGKDNINRELNHDSLI